MNDYDFPRLYSIGENRLFESNSQLEEAASMIAKSVSEQIRKDLNSKCPEVF